MPSRKVNKTQDKNKKKNATSKINRKKAFKKNPRRARKVKAHRPQIAQPQPETVQEKLDRFKRQHPKAREDEIEVQQEDLDFFMNQGDGAINIIEGMSFDGGALKKRGRKLKKEKMALKNIPASWEETRQKQEWNATGPAYLPIKRFNGAIVEATVQRPENPLQTLEESDTDPDEDHAAADTASSVSQDEEAGDLDEDLPPELLKAKFYQQRNLRVHEMKTNLARLAAQILQDPEHHLNKLAQFRSLCSEENDVTVKKYIILSEAAVFKDVIPGYRIRSLTEEEKKIKVSKEVLRLRAYENLLLNLYQQFLLYLDAEIKGAPKLHFSKNSPLNTFTSVCAKCLGTLLVSVPHFNFRSNLVNTLVPLMNSDNTQIAGIAQNAVEELYQQDTDGEAALEISKKVSTFIKTKSYRVKTEVLRSYLKLPLTEELPEGTDIIAGYTPKTKHISKKARKREKSEKQLESDMKESLAEQNKERHREVQTQTLKVIFLIYFKIIKSPGTSPLLPAVLEGLARFSHLINVEVLLNILDVLREMILRPTLDPMSKLNCAITAFQTLKYQGESLSIDLKEFYNRFYSIVWDILPHVTTNEEFIPTVLRCFQLMFTENKQLSLDRVAAFIKRILMLTLYLSPNSAIAVIAIVRMLFLKYPRTQQLLDNEYKGTGVYQPEVDDPEHCNAFAATAWEFSLLKQHGHSVLSNYSRLVSTMSSIDGNHTPEELFKFYMPNHDEKTTNKGVSYCYPPIQPPTRHPLEKKVERLSKRQGTSKKEIMNAWFVRPASLEPSPFLKELKEKDGNFVRELSENKVKEEFAEYFEDLSNLAVINEENVQQKERQ